LLNRQAKLTRELRPHHAVKAVADAIREMAQLTPDFILIVGASAISDRQDIIPQAIVNCGGVIEHFGMPMDPGNLLLMARLDHIAVVGLPGCARSSKYNGFDKVLDKLVCRLPVTREWLTSLGVGGLLKEMVDRPQPRAVPQQNPQVAALLLAAGSSSRFGKQNKLLALWRGKPLVQHALTSILQSSVEKTTIVTGYQPGLVSEAINTVENNKALTIVHNDAHSTGMASSLKAGVSALIESDAIVVCLGDMPDVDAGVIDSLIDAFRENSEKALYIPTNAGQRGNPVLIARRLFDSVLGLDGDTGARVLAKQFPDTVLEVEVGSIGVELDVDRQEDLL